MKRFFVLTMLFLAVSAFPGDGKTGIFQLQSNGSFQVEDLTFSLVVRNPKWASAIQSSKTIRASADGLRSDRNGFHLQGDFLVRNGTFKLDERFAFLPSNRARYEVSLNSVEPVPCAELCLEALLPVSRFLAREIRFDGKTVNFGKNYQAKCWVLDLPVKQIEIPLQTGTLRMEGNLRVRLQDNRRYQKNGDWSLRILLNPRSGTIREAGLKLDLHFVRPFSCPLSFAGAANMGFADPVAEDHIGGWTDQGPDNDLKMFPSGKQFFAGIPFRILRPEENEGKAVIALRGEQRPYFPSFADVAVPQGTRAKYLWVLHALGWEPKNQRMVGRVFVEYENDGFTERDEETFSVRSGMEVGDFWGPRTLSHASVAWKGRNSSAEIGIYVTRFKLSGKKIRRIRFASEGNAAWLIAGATLSDSAGNTGSGGTPVIIGSGPEWIPVERRTSVIPGSIMDFSGLLHRPAGKYGYLRNVCGRFEFEKRPGVHARFYGVNIAFMMNFMDRERTDRLVEHLSRSGYNLLRLHHFDDLLTEAPHRGDSPFVGERLDRLHYLIARCREAGIYLTLDLYTIRRPDASISHLIQDGIVAGSEYKALFFLDEGVRNDFFTFSRRLLNTVNPYTGLALKDDPAVCMLSFLNEDTIFATAKRTPRIAALFEERYQQYLKRNRLVLTQKNRDALWRAFLSDIYRNGFSSLRKFAKETGLKMPLTDQNYWTDIGTSLLRSEYDYIDNHFYWAHPSFLGKNWQLPARFETKSAIQEFAGGVSGQFPCREFGKPYSVSEWNYCHPNRYNLEGAFLMGAYSALQNWDSLCRFTFSHTIRSLDDRKIVTTFDIAEDPVRTLSEIAAQLFYLRGDVAPSRHKFVILLDPDHWKNPSNPSGFPLYLRRLGLIGQTGFQIAGPGRNIVLPEQTSLVSGSETLQGNFAGVFPFLSWKLGIAEGLREIVKAGFLSAKDAENNRFRSDTGEILLDSENTTFLVSTSHSEGMVLEKNRSLKGNFAEVHNQDTFAGVLIASKDGKSLKESRRLLVLHLTRIANTGETYRDADCNILESRGKSPLLLRRGKARMTLRRDFQGFRLYAVDPNGKRLSECPFRTESGKTILELNNTHDGRGVLAYELIGKEFDSQ